MLFLESLVFQRHLDDDEEIYFIAHKHWVAFLKPFFRNIFFGYLVPWILYAIFPPFIIIAICWSVMGTIRMFYDFIDWYCDAWLVTSLGIIDLEWKGIFHHTSSRTEYASLEGVSHEITGFWGTVLRFGKTQLDKLGNATPSVLEYANNPKHIELRILEFKEKFNDSRGREESEALKQILADMVSRHIKEKGWPESTTHSQMQAEEHPKQEEYEEEYEDENASEFEVSQPISIPIEDPLEEESPDESSSSFKKIKF